jgi:thiamine biosynthesis protein ThiS
LGFGAGAELRASNGGVIMRSFVIANGSRVEAALPCSLEEFLIAQKLLPKSVVVEHNGEAVAPSEFSQRTIRAEDKLEIVKIVAGG